jgi:hypothetical protein
VVKILKSVVLFSSFLLCLGVATGCVPKEELDSDDLEPSMEWEDILSHEASGNEIEEETTASSAAQTAPLMSKKQAMDAQVERSRAALLGDIQNAAPYAGGILGMKGSSKYFIATVSTIPEYDRLYWVIVKVLSEKYSCFIRAKQDIGLMTRFTCRDKRQVLFWKKKNNRFIEFTSRQFDRDGYEIQVIKKQIVRISSQKVI